MPLLAGDAGVEQTVELMRRLIDRGVTDPELRALTIKILRDSGAPPHDPLAKADAIYSWVHTNIYFVNDPVDSDGDPKETLSPARDILQFGGGDCDDFAVLMSTLLQIAGFQTHIVTVASDPRDPGQFTHVYPEVEIDGAWIPVDAARPGAHFGLAPEHVYRRKVWSSASILKGLGQQRFSLAGYTQLRHLPKLPMGDAQDLITAGGQSIADIISAARAAPQNIYGGVATGPGQIPSTTVYGGGYPAISPYAGYPAVPAVTSPFGTLTTGGLLIGLAVLGIGAALLFRR